MLLHNLVSLGYLQRDLTTRKFVPTLRIALLGSGIQGRLNQYGQFAKMLDALVSAVDETAFLAAQNGQNLHYMLAQHPDKARHFHLPPSNSSPIMRSAGGRVLLSKKTDSEILDVLRQCYYDVEEDRLRRATCRFMKIIEVVRMQGYAETNGDIMANSATIAVYVPVPIGAMTLAIGVGATTRAIARKRERVVNAIRSTALALAADALRHSI
jgi:DNA-binding IclR family transcriptional regulator